MKKKTMHPHVRPKPIMEPHHRKPKSKGGTKRPANISKVRQTQHRAWHTLFANYSPAEIVAIINAIWLDPDFYLILRYTKGRKP